MRGKRIVLCFLLALLNQYSSAQDADPLFDAVEGFGKPSHGHVFILGVSGGIGKYFQTDLKEINRTVQNGLNFETKLTDNFPATFYYGMYLLFTIDRNLSIGPDYQFHTTGSRLAYRDYSGSYTFDQILSCHSPAIRVEATPGKSKNPQFCFSALFGINITTWRISENLIVGEVHEGSETRFDALRPFMYPMVKFRYKITPLISLVPSAGWNFDLSGGYHLHNMKDATTNYVASWSGPRAELSIDLSF